MNPQKRNISRMTSLENAAALVKVPPETIREFIEHRGICGKQTGSEWRVNVRDLLRKWGPGSGRIRSGRRSSVFSHSAVPELRRPVGAVDNGPAVIVQTCGHDDLLFSTGNGPLHIDWLVGKRWERNLVTIPSFTWFNPVVKRHVRVGNWAVRLLVNGKATQLWHSLTWYGHSAVPQTDYDVSAYGQTFNLTVRGFCPPQSQAFIQSFAFKNLTSESFRLELEFVGNLCLGDENEFLRGEIMAYPGCGLEALPAAVVRCAPLSNGMRIENRPGRMFAELTGTDPAAGIHLTKHVEKHRLDGAWLKGPRRLWRVETVNFKAVFALTLPAKKEKQFALTLNLGTAPVEVRKQQMELRKEGTASLFNRTIRSWQRVLAPLENAATPDRLFNAALGRCAAYVKMCSIPMRKEKMGKENYLITDHVCFTVENPRDCFYQACALLYFAPRDVEGYLRFQFETAIPRNGFGYMSFASGESPSKEGRDFELDMVSYPFLLLYRYWRLTEDDALAKGAAVRAAAARMLTEIQEHYYPANGLYASVRRPSDELCLLPCNIPDNMLLYCMLEKLAEMADEAWGDARQTEQLRRVASQVRKAIYKTAVVRHEKFGRLFAFEVAPSGRYFLYDQADLPNLLTAPYFGFCRLNNPIYQNTLRFIYSTENEGYAETSDGYFRALCDGTKQIPDGPWPIAMMAEIMVAPRNPAKVQQAVDRLCRTITYALQFSETVTKDRGIPLCRLWFAYACGLFVMMYVEALCGIQLGKKIKIRPNPPETWGRYQSPLLQVHGREVRVVIENGKPGIWIDGKRKDIGCLSL